VAFLFGSERFGMPTRTCTAAMWPEHSHQPGFGSLNLGAAIQVIAYEWRQALGGFAVQDARCPPRAAGRCAQVAGMLAHWEQALVASAFSTRQRPRSSCRA
jgi:tRNA/rRNA methyltransferase